MRFARNPFAPTEGNCRDSPAPRCGGDGLFGSSHPSPPKQKNPAGIRRDWQRPKAKRKRQTCGTLPRPHKQPTGLICAPLRRGRAVRVLSSFAAKTKKSRRDTAGLAAPQSRKGKPAGLSRALTNSPPGCLRPAAAGTDCSSPLVLRRQNKKIPPGYGGIFVLVEDEGLEPTTSAM